MVDDARDLLAQARRSDDLRLHRTLSDRLAGLSPAQLEPDEVQAFYPHLDELDDTLLRELSRHAADTAFVELTAYIITTPQGSGTRDFCFSRLCQKIEPNAQRHSPILLALLKSDPSRALKRMRTLEQYDAPQAQQVRLRIAFEGLLNGGEQTLGSWKFLQNVGFEILNTPLHSDEERESLVWLTRLADLKTKPDSLALLLEDAQQKTPKERHRLLCAVVANPRSHSSMAELLSTKACTNVLAAILDTLCDEVDIKRWQQRWDFSQPLLSLIQEHCGAAALAPLKRMLASYSVCAQRHRDRKRQREIAHLLRPVALHFQTHQAPYAQSFDVRRVLAQRFSTRTYLKSV